MNYRAVLGLTGTMMILLGIAVLDFRMGDSFLSNWGRAPVLGHILRAYGTVKLISPQSPKRLPTGQSAMIPLHIGEGVQTGEDSAAEILFFGGHTLRVEKASYIVFEERSEEYLIRLMMGRAYLEIPQFSQGKSGLSFENSSGDIKKIPSGKKWVLTLSAMKDLEEAVEVNVVESNQSEDSLAEMELRHLAYGEEVEIHHPLIVPPVEEKREEKSRSIAQTRMKAPRPVFPHNESEFDVEVNRKSAFAWQEMGKNFAGYEVVVRPAFKYETQDTARARQTLPTRGSSVLMEKVGGGGVFLWSVRAVQPDGQRGPASAPRWVEIKFPKQLMAPNLIKPKVK